MPRYFNQQTKLRNRIWCHAGSKFRRSLMKTSQFTVRRNTGHRTSIRKTNPDRQEITNSALQAHQLQNFLPISRLDESYMLIGLKIICIACHLICSNEQKNEVCHYFRSALVLPFLVNIVRMYFGSKRKIG